MDLKELKKVRELSFAYTMKCKWGEHKDKQISGHAIRRYLEALSDYRTEVEGVFKEEEKEILCEVCGERIATEKVNGKNVCDNYDCYYEFWEADDWAIQNYGE